MQMTPELTTYRLVLTNASRKPMTFR